MANALYPLWKQALMSELDVNKSLDQDNADNGCYLSLVSIIGGGYTYSDSDQFYSSVTGVVSGPVRITNAVVAGKIFSGDIVVFSGVTGAQIGAIVMHRKNPIGASDTWRLVLYEDTGITGLPMIPSGGNVIVKWNVQGIFAL